MPYVNIRKPALRGAWDVSAALYNESVSVAAHSDDPESIYFRGDGLKMYILGSNSDSVSEYDLTIPWEISTISFVQSLVVSGQDAVPEAIFFKPDGLKMYMLGIGGDRVYEYDLSVAWNISTAVNNRTFSIAAQDTIARGMFFKPDGMKMYISGSQTDKIYEYDLSVAWDVTTASFLQSKSISAQTNTPDGIFFRADGLRMYMVNFDTVFQYSLNTAWNISTMTFDQSFLATSSGAAIFSLFFSPDGNNMFLTNGTIDAVDNYELNTLSSYTNIPKPAGGAPRFAGMTMGLLIPLTKIVYIPESSLWVKISKPTGSSYTNVPKPT